MIRYQVFNHLGEEVMHGIGKFTSLEDAVNVLKRYLVQEQINIIYTHVIKASFTSESYPSTRNVSACYLTSENRLRMKERLEEIMENIR